MKRAMLLAMVSLCVLGWYVTGKGLVEKPAEYNRLIAEAEHYEEEKIYIKAMEAYKNALAYNPKSIDIQTRIAVDYLAIGDESSFINRCNSINEANGYPVSVSILLADFYMERNRNEDAITLLKKALKEHKEDEQLKARYDQLRYTYKDLYKTYDEILAIRNDSAVFIQNGHYGLLSKEGQAKIRGANSWVGPLSSDGEMVPMEKDGEYYYGDEDGYRVEVPQEGQQIEALGVLEDNIAPAKVNGKYGYLNGRFEEISPFSWDGATVMKNGIAAVKQGERWALINEKFELVTDFIYDDVKTDEYGYGCVEGTLLFVKQGDTYHLVNEKGETIGDGGYEDAFPFIEKEAAAVKKGGKWGFIGTDGSYVIEPQYENAKSFSGGLAPVDTGNGWGYIDEENHLVIADDFSDAGNFIQGVAPVKYGTYWSMIKLNMK